LFAQVQAVIGQSLNQMETMRFKVMLQDPNAGNAVAATLQGDTPTG